MKRGNLKLVAVTAQTDGNGFAEVYGVDGYGNLRHIGEFAPMRSVVSGTEWAVRNDDRLTQETERIDVAEQRAKEIAEALRISAVASYYVDDEKAFRLCLDLYRQQGKKLPDVEIPDESTTVNMYARYRFWELAERNKARFLYHPHDGQWLWDDGHWARRGDVRA